LDDFLEAPSDRVDGFERFDDDLDTTKWCNAASSGARNTKGPVRNRPRSRAWPGSLRVSMKELFEVFEIL
jgi:hypothetical protein